MTLFTYFAIEKTKLIQIAKFMDNLFGGKILHSPVTISHPSQSIVAIYNILYRLLIAVTTNHL